MLCCFICIFYGTQSSSHMMNPFWASGTRVTFQLLYSKGATLERWCNQIYINIKRQRQTSAVKKSVQHFGAQKKNTKNLRWLWSWMAFVVAMTTNKVKKTSTKVQHCWCANKIPAVGRKKKLYCQVDRFALRNESTKVTTQSIEHLKLHFPSSAIWNIFYDIHRVDGERTITL